MLKNHHRLIGLSGIVLTSFLSASCSAPLVPVFPVQGKVLVEGVPAEGAVVAFHPVAASAEVDQWMIRGGVTETGELMVRTYRLPRGDEPRMGAPAGEYIVTVSLIELPPKSKINIDQVNDRYSEPEKSPLRVTIKPGPNDLEPFRLSQK